MDTLEQLKNIQGGQRVVYHVGTSIAKSGSYALRNAAYQLHIDDKAFLVQKKLETGLYEYIAIGKKAPPNPKEINKRVFYIKTIEGKVS